MKFWRKFSLFFLFCLILPSSLFAAIAEDAVLQHTSSNNGVSSLTTAFSVGAGSNRALICIAYNGDGDTTTAFTYAGDSLTKTESQIVADANSSEVALYYLMNPDSGSNNLVLTRSTATNRIRYACVSYTGVLQSEIDVTGKDYSAVVAGVGTLQLTPTGTNEFMLLGAVAADETEASTNATLITDGLLPFMDLFEFTGNPTSAASSMSINAGGNGNYRILEGLLLFPDDYTPQAPATSSLSNFATTTGTSTAQLIGAVALGNSIIIVLLSFGIIVYVWKEVWGKRKKSWL